MVDVVIVNWNSGEMLLQCINTLLLPSNLAQLNKVFIIDNNSADNSIALLPPNDKIVILRNQQNLGFSKACNQGFKLANAPFVLLLNPDTRLFDTTLSDCIQFMQSNIDVDIAGCKLLNEDGSTAISCARFPTVLHMCYDSIGLAKIAPRIFTPSNLMTDWNHSESRFVDQVMGAFMFIRKEVFQKLGYFDERFFVYFEELDFSKRLAELGGKSYYTHSAKAYHVGGGTTHRVKAFRLYLNLKSRLQYAKKHFSFLGYMLVAFCTFFIEPFSRLLFLMIKGDFIGIGQLLQAYKKLVLS